MVKKTRTILSNGLPLIVIEIPGSKSLVTSFWTKAGGRVDPKAKAGMAHFIEHLLIKKTKRFSSDEKLANVLERVGAFKNGTTSKDWLNLNISSSSKDLSLICMVLSEMIFNPLIDKKGFEAERKVILQEQARRFSLPDELVWDAWFNVFFSPTPLTRSVIGTKESMNNILLKDSTDFWKKYFNSKSSILMVSGGIEAKTAIKVTQRYFGKSRLNEAQKFPRYKFSGAKRIYVEKKDLPRTNMLISFRTPGGHIGKDDYPLLVLKSILSSGWSSRIAQRLRVKESLIYGWHSSLKGFFDTGALIFTLASARGDFSKMVNVFCEEIIKIRESGIKESELLLAKGFIEGSLLSGMETSWDYTDWYAYDELYWPEYVESIEDRIKGIKQVLKEDVERIARKYLTANNWHLGVVGDIRQENIKVEL